MFVQMQVSTVVERHTLKTSSSSSRLVRDRTTLREAWQSGSPCADAGGALRVTVQPNLTCTMQ